jgi:hypothetical protein
VFEWPAYCRAIPGRVPGVVLGDEAVAPREITVEYQGSVVVPSLSRKIRSEKRGDIPGSQGESGDTEGSWKRDGTVRTEGIRRVIEAFERSQDADPALSNLLSKR